MDVVTPYLLGLGLALGLAPGPVWAAPLQEPPPPVAAVPRAEAASRTIYVDVRDARGEAERGLTADDFTVTEAGAVRAATRLQPLDAAAGEWQISIYFDRAVSDSGSVRQAAQALADRAMQLVAAGSVEIVVADPDPHVALPATRDVHLVSEALSRVFLDPSPNGGQVTRRRRDFLERLAAGEATAPVPGASRREALAALTDEVALLRRQQDRLIGWAAAQEAAAGPRALLVVDDGAGTISRAFYGAALPEGTLPAVAPGELALEAPPALELAQALDAYGWVTLPLAIDAPSTEPGEGEKAYAKFKSETTYSGSTSSSPTLDLSGLFKKIREKHPQEAEKAAPPPDPRPRSVEAQKALADATGGERLARPEEILPAIARLARRLALTFPAAPATEAELHPLTVTVARKGATVRAPQWVASATPEVVADVRMRRLLGGEPGEGDLPVICTLSVDPDATGRRSAGVALRVDLSPLGAERARLTAALLRVTYGIASEGEPPVLRRERVSGQDLSGLDEWSYGSTLVLPPEADRVAVVVEVLGTGLWGVGSATVPPPPGGGAGTGVEAPPAVAAPPPPEPFRVAIAGPLGKPAAGWVEVTAEVSVPAGRKLDRLDFFWNDQLLASATGPPFKRTLHLPEKAAGGYVRVSGQLDDGTTAEDVATLDAERFGEVVSVKLVELYVAVAGDKGKPVRGLAKDDFVVREDGVSQQIAVFDDAAGDLPIAIGLAIDSSASMFVKLPAVVRAVRSFLQSLLPGRDRAFLVAFGNQPRLLQPLTGDLQRVASILDSIEPEGLTSLWQSIAYSLKQLAPVSGKKALVVFSDGADDDEDEFPYRDCLEAARLSKVPIYLILMNNEAARTNGKGFRTRFFTSRLDRLVEVGGGNVYYVRTNGDLESIYRDIGTELRTHYLLAYYPADPAKEDRWRKVAVEVKRRGLTARTLSGYYPDHAAPSAP